MEFSENELASMICDNDEDVNEALYKKYSYLVTIVINKNKDILNNLKIELDEAKQESFYALNEALTTYRDDRDASLKVYIINVIEYRVQKLIRKKLRKKSKDEINNVSLENSNNALLKITSDLKYNPENLILSNENYNTMLNNIIISLSPNEKEIFNLIKENYSYNDISKILNLNIKQVYNSVYRIKDKVKTIIEN